MAIFYPSPVTDFHGSEGRSWYMKRSTGCQMIMWPFTPFAGWGNGNRIFLIFFFMKSRIPYAVHVLCYN